MPFTSQAPYGKWHEPWKNACEEASIAMVDFFYAKKIFTTPAIAAAHIEHIFSLKEFITGKSLDETADMMATIINTYLPWEAVVVSAPTLEDMLNELDHGRPIILPAYGTALANSYFLSDQLDYHVLVLSGYNAQKKTFIAQEPGTSRGLDFEYSFDTIMTAMHDFIPEKTATSPQVALFTRPIAMDSRFSDGDTDGLTKEQEIASGTVLWLSDTDTDGYTDGEEVLSGYSPILAEKTLPPNTLIKSSSSPDVYLIDINGTKRHIANESAFIRRGYRWQDINIVSDRFLQSLRTKDPIF